MKKGMLKKPVSILLALLLILSLQLAPLAVFAEEDSDDYFKHIEEAVRLVNAERSKEGLSEYVVTYDLCYAAYLRAMELSLVYDHVRPDGSQWYTVFDDYGIKCSNASENVAYGFKSISDVVEAWMNLPGNRANILSTDFNYIGVGYYHDGVYEYWALLFITSDVEYGEEEILTISSSTCEQPGQLPEDIYDEIEENLDETAETEESGNIQSIEVAQVMGKGMPIEDGSLYNMQLHVAGKNTAILVSLKKPVTVDPSGKTQYVIITREEKEIARLKPLGAEKKTNLLEFLPQNLKEVDNWAEGDYTITAVVGNDTGSVNVKFRERMTMRILAVPIKGNWGGEIKSCEGQWKTGGKFTQTVYPLKNGGLIWELAPELDLSDSKYDLTTDDGCYEVWKALASKKTRDNRYTLIVGFARDWQGEGGKYAGYTYGMPATVVTETDQDMMATVAHEIAHCYDIGEEYPGGAINMKVNPAPYGTEGVDWYTREEIVANKEFIKGNRDEFGYGSLILPEQHPYEPYGRGLLGTMVSYMGYGAKQSQIWTTSALWEHLFKSFAHNGNQIFSAGNEEEQEQEKRISLIDISGTINKDGTVILDPSYHYEGLWEHVEEPEGKGYFAVLLDKDGKELEKVEFGVSFTTMSNPPISVDKAPFFVTLKYSQEVKAIEIRHGTETVYRAEATENKPELSFTPIPSDKEFTGKYTVTWQSEDKDGDKLFYELWYAPNEEGLICLANNITDTSYEVDFDALPGGKEAKFYLYATDGINTTIIESNSFAVEYKAPEVLTEQSEPQKFRVTDEIYIEVDVYDPQDGYMYEPEGQIVWTDEKGEIVSEDYALLLFPYELAIGEHTFTMTATNSGGKSVSKEYKFIIEDDESALPQSWSREEFKQALMYWLVDPSLMYGYANDASRIDLAATAVNLYFMIAEDIEEIIDNIEFSEESPYSDFEDEDGYAELAVTFGFLTADGDLFEPHKPVTRSEMVDVYCKVLEKAGFEIDQNARFKKEYADIGELTGVSRTNMAYMNSIGAITGYGNDILAPMDFATREQVVVVAKRIVDALFE
ncbi:MAG TPA: hypothetical protein GXX14_14075 [Clostridiaceae bacterium]|nr:hypothetical protein [Clostridiaceae bacterium]